jgi:hypothetical protein
MEEEEKNKETEQNDINNKQNISENESTFVTNNN